MVLELRFAKRTMGSQSHAPRDQRDISNKKNAAGNNFSSYLSSESQRPDQPVMRANTITLCSAQFSQIVPTNFVLRIMFSAAAHLPKLALCRGWNAAPLSDSAPPAELASDDWESARLQCQFPLFCTWSILTFDPALVLPMWFLARSKLSENNPAPSSKVFPEFLSTFDLGPALILRR